MMPHWRKPVSAPTRSFMPCHNRRLSMISGISRGSRAILRHQPQLRLDCSPAMCPFSHSTTETPFSARNRAVLTPMMPPPMTTTSACAGTASSERTGSTRGAMACPYPSLDRRMREVRDAVEPQRMPRIGLHIVGQIAERDAARRIGPGIGGAGAAMPEGLGRGQGAETADALAVAADMRPEAAMHRDAVHRVVAALAGMVAGHIGDEPRRQQPHLAEPAPAEQHLIERDHAARRRIAAAARHAGGLEFR